MAACWGGSRRQSCIGCLGFAAALGGFIGLGFGRIFSGFVVGLGGGFLVLAAVRQVLLLAGLEVSLVPAAALEAESRRRKELLQPGFAAFGPLPKWSVADLLQVFQLVAAGLTLILIYRHGRISRRRIGTPYVRTRRIRFKSRRRRGVPL